MLGEPPAASDESSPCAARSRANAAANAARETILTAGLRRKRRPAACSTIGDNSDTHPSTCADVKAGSLSGGGFAQNFASSSTDSADGGCCCGHAVRAATPVARSAVKAARINMGRSCS